MRQSSTYLPGVLPSQQAQESWHRQLRRLLKGKLRQSFAVVMQETFPRILRADTRVLPDDIRETLEHVNPYSVLKALKILDEEEERVRVSDDRKVVFILRFKSEFKKITKALEERYRWTLQGEEPLSDPKYKQANNAWDEFKAIARITQSMHMIVHTPDDVEGAVFSCQQNPARLFCTCKGYRGYGCCAHVMATTAVLYPEEHFDRDYLAMLADKIVPKSKRPAHRPKDARPGTQIQPDSSDEEEEEEGYTQDMDEDLWEVGTSSSEDADDDGDGGLGASGAGSSSTPAAAKATPARVVVEISSDEDTPLSQRARGKRPATSRTA